LLLFLSLVFFLIIFIFLSLFAINNQLLESHLFEKYILLRNTFSCFLSFSLYLLLSPFPPHFFRFLNSQLLAISLFGRYYNNTISSVFSSLFSLPLFLLFTVNCTLILLYKKFHKDPFSSLLFLIY